MMVPILSRLFEEGDYEEKDMFPNNDTGDALRRLHEDGSDLTRPMKIDFFVVVPNEKSGLKLALKAEEMGFETSVELDDETTEWTCYCAKNVVPGYQNIEKLEQLLASLGNDYGGYYDGFGTYGN